MFRKDNQYFGILSAVAGFYEEDTCRSPIVSTQYSVIFLRWVMNITVRPRTADFRFSISRENENTLKSLESLLARLSLPEVLHKVYQDSDKALFYKILFSGKQVSL